MNKTNAAAGKRAKRLYFGGGIAAVLAALVLFGVLAGTKKAYLETETKARAAAISSGPSVYVTTAKRGGNVRTVMFSGEARPYATVTLYAKISGYLREIKVDKGDRVRTGQLLAVLESPELDRQYDAAIADAKNKRAFAERQKTLFAKGFISRQDSDNAEADAKVSEAGAASLLMQKGYETLLAPFPATVTARFVDPGALVQSAVTSQTTALPVVTLSQTDRLRVYVYVDQKNAALVRTGDRAEISDASRPDVRLSASVSRISGELDPRTRTLLVELDVENRQGLIVPGSFVQVALHFKAAPMIEVPAQALLIKDEKTFVGVVSADNRVNFVPVAVSESDGTTVKLSAGLGEGERVVLSPGGGIGENQLVRPVVAKEGK